MDDDLMTESPEEKAFFDSKGAETVETPEPELPLQEEQVKEEAKEEAKEEHTEAPKTVPLAALLEERREAKVKYDRMMARLDKLQDLVQPPAPPPEKVDPTVDPIKALQDLQEWRDSNEKQGKETAEEQAIGNFAKQHADAFRQVKPDFDDAYNFIRANRANELMNSGRATMEDVGLQLRAEEKQIIKTAAQFQVSPAAFMYALAQAGGYTPKAQEKEQVPEVKQPTAEEKVKMVAEGQARASNPVSKAGAGSNGKIDLKALAMLDDDEWDKATEGKNWEKMWKN